MIDSQFEQRYLRRLHKAQWNERHLPTDGPFRFVRFREGNAFYTREIETMVSDLALVTSADPKPIWDYIGFAAIEAKAFYQMPCRVRPVGGDGSLGRFVWYSLYPVNGFVFDSPADQVILKLVFPELR